MLNRLSQQIRSLFSRPTRRRRARFGNSERLEPRELLTTVVELVEDLGQQPNGSNRIFNNIAEANGLHFFTAFTLEHGNELWRTDGTTEGTFRLTDLKSDRESNFAVDHLLSFQNRLYFVAQDYELGGTLWVSDGTVAGTHNAADIDPLSANEFITQSPVATDDAIYFVVNSHFSNQVYRYDGATGNVNQVTSFSGAGYYISNLTGSGSSAYITRNVVGKGIEIWRLGDKLGDEALITELDEGSAIADSFGFEGNFLFTELNAGETRVWNVNPQGALSEITSAAGIPGQLRFDRSVVSGGKLFLTFSTFGGQASSEGLWVTDGTAEGSFLLSTGTTRSPIAVNGTVFYLQNGRLWKTDGTQEGTQSVDIDQTFYHIVSESGRLYLEGFNNSLWVSDGTQNGTHRIESNLRLSLTDMNTDERGSEFAFWADDGIHGWELWVTDGSEGAARMVADLHPGTATSYFNSLAAITGDLYLNVNGFRSFRLRDGQPPEILNPANSTFTYQLTVGENVAYFINQYFSTTTVLKSDQTEVKVIKDYLQVNVMTLATFQDEAFYFTFNGIDGGLWHTDGSETGTRLLKSFATGFVSQLYVDDVLGDVWFTLDDGIHGTELWMSDGTVGGTHLVRDITPGSNGSFLNDIYIDNGLAYFTVSGQAWISDGTETGTMPLEAVESALGIIATDGFAGVDNDLFMSSYTSDRHWEVVRTRGSADSTVYVTNLSEPSSSIAGAPFNLTSFRGQLAFAAWDADGLGLWNSDGNTSTRLAVLSSEATIANWSIAEDTLFFTVNDRMTGAQEIWASDGTAQGTRKLRPDRFDVLYVPENSKFVEYAGGIAFAAGTNEYGVELVRIDTTFALQAPTGLSVAPRGPSVPSLVHVTWDEMPGANDYEVQILNFATQVVVTQQLLGVNQFDSNTLPSGAYRVLVRGRSITGDLSPWAEVAPFAIGIPVVQPVATSSSIIRNFQWASPLGAISNEVWLTNRDAGTRVLYQTGVTGNSLATPSPLAPARYAVWVRSRLPGGQVTDWSATVEFDVLAPAPTLTSGSGTSNDGLPVISWTAVPGAASYQVQIHPVGSNTPLLSVSGLTSTTYRVPQPMAGGRYLISIRAMKGTRQFAVPLLNQPLFVRRAPAGLKAQVNGFSWSASPGALTYGYEIRNVRTNAVVMQGSQTSTIVQRSTAFPPGQYQARVFATYSGGVNTQWSTPLVFEEFRPALTITSAWTPTADATPSVTWSAGTDVTTYEVQAYRQGSAVIAYSARGLTTTSHRIANALTAGTYVIQVRANYADGTRSVWSAVRTRVIGPAPVLTQTGRTISWASIPDATHYEFWVNYLGPNAPITKAVYVPALAQTQYSLASTLPKGRYQVWVRAIRAEAGELYAGLWGSNGAFEIS